MNPIDPDTRRRAAPITLVKEVPVNPVRAVVITSNQTAEDHRMSTIDNWAVDLFLTLKNAGFNPYEVFAVCSIMESITRDHSKIVDTGPEECDMVWKEDRFA